MLHVEVAKGAHNGLSDADGNGLEFEQIDFEQPPIFTGKPLNMDDGGFQQVAGEAHRRAMLDQPLIRVVTKFREECRESIPTRQVLHIFAGEFVVCFQHAPTSTFQLHRVGYLSRSR